MSVVVVQCRADFVSGTKNPSFSSNGAMYLMQSTSHSSNTGPAWRLRVWEGGEGGEVKPLPLTHWHMDH